MSEKDFQMLLVNIGHSLDSNSHISLTGCIRITFTLTKPDRKARMSFTEKSLLLYDITTTVLRSIPSELVFTSPGQTTA